MIKTTIILYKYTFFIWTTMMNSISHLPKNIRSNSMTIFIKYSYKSTHRTRNISLRLKSNIVLAFVGNIKLKQE